MGRLDGGRLCCYCASPMNENDSFCPECGRLQTIMPLSRAAVQEVEDAKPIRPAPPVQTPLEPDPEWFVDLSNAPLAPLNYKFPEPPDEDPALPDPLAETRRFEAPRPEPAAAVAGAADALPHLVYPGRLYAHPQPDAERLGQAQPADPQVESELEAQHRFRVKLVIGLTLALISLLLLGLAGIMIHRAMTKFPQLARPGSGVELLWTADLLPPRWVLS
ncbi:MAG: hypothetical protein QM296_08835 [Bacillota bacterium]|nr:hypothetical protein [Bacillota bacterium]